MGYDTKVLRKVIAIRKQDANDRLEQEASSTPIWMRWAWRPEQKTQLNSDPGYQSGHPKLPNRHRQN